MAFKFAKEAHESMYSNSQDLQNVLFAICLHNFQGYLGFRMDSMLYGAHPNESEMLLMEGLPVFVLGVKEMEVDNSLTGDDFWNELNMKRVTVIYLFHTSY